MSSMGVNYTCITCRVKFANAELQRDHYKNEWHRYNLKRKEADLPPITFKLFEEKKEQFSVQKNKEIIEATTQVNTYCAACGKLFKSKNSFETHLNSKKHKENEIKYKEKIETSSTPVVFTISKKGKNVVSSDVNDVHMNELHTSENEATNSGEEDLDDKHLSDDEVNEKDAIDTKTCLFCPQKFDCFENNWEHIKKAHGFIFPDRRFVRDEEAFVEYLGYKIGCGRVCIYCSDKTRRFPTIESCQQHMIDKSHCKINIDGDNIIEYYEFYDYTPLFDENDDEFIDQNNPMIDEGFSLILPSGTNIGHRSLQKYYKQNLRHSTEILLYNGSERKMKNFTVKAIGYGELATPEVMARARDMKFLRKLKDKYILQLGVKGNKLFKSKGNQGQAY
uniref:C2H2-type domain-containing protein n=1 Tax=Parastrongyloides trichosuri TaxID=131310 RepID=A0A0N4ZYE9_PARTI